MHTPEQKQIKTFTDASEAALYVEELYNHSITFLRDQFDNYCGDPKEGGRVRAFYPYIRMCTKTRSTYDTRLAYGFLSSPGSYSTTVTRPDIFGHYYREQIAQLLKNHECPVEVGYSETPIPIHFALEDDYSASEAMCTDDVVRLSSLFDQPDLMVMDDQIANGTYRVKDGADSPLSLFKATRVDLSLKRLRHYTATSAKHFQNYVLFTNYQFYIDEFVSICREIMTKTDDPKKAKYRSEYTAFIEPGNVITCNENISEDGNPHCPMDRGNPPPRLPQMPAWHLKRPDGSGITMINIGVGPSNAKTITDHVAVLRPHTWLMLGHCAGLRNSQSLGDYVLAHAYLREDQILDRDLPVRIPVPALAEVQQALAQSVAEITDYKGYELKKIMRTGTVATIDDRNWELRPSMRQNLRLSQSRAIALDMESGTVAANGYRFRVPYGTLLCVSDKPLHGQLKLPGMADQFYRERVDQHLRIGLRTMEILREFGIERLHSRKLRSFNEVAFQ